MRVPLDDAEVRELRREFPALDDLTYFASNGLGVMPRCAVHAVAERAEALSRSAILAEIFEHENLLREARESVARLLGCAEDEVAFCRNTTEGALWVADSLSLEPGDEVLVVQGEYPANILPWMAQERRGVVTRLLRQRQRRITPAMVADAWGPRTRLLAISFVQFNSGFRADLAGLAEVVHGHRGWLFCDAIQGLGALQLNVRAAGVDFLSAGTHKWLLGAQGLGIFYASPAALAALDTSHLGPGGLVNDGDPEDPEAPYDRTAVAGARRFEEGSRNYLGLAALNASLRLLETLGYDRIEARVRRLTDAAVAAFAARGFRFESPAGVEERSGILLFAPPPGGPTAADLVNVMHQQRIAINAREGCIHMGIHFYNLPEDLDRVMAAIDAQRGK